MHRHEQIDRLKSRLYRESGGPIEHLVQQATDAFASKVGVPAAWGRAKAAERPLVSLLAAFQLGFASGRWGPRREKR
jgi:hypothetical protein